MMLKTCPAHGTFEDVIAIDPAFLARIESLFFGRDVAMQADALHNHGSSSIKYGRGAVLTVDLTNRCNMMCDPCFMDANQVGFVHELAWDDITKILDDAADVKPRRQMSIQFSGGEPTLSPFFLDAIRYAKKKGYFAVQCATNGLRFAEEPGFAKACQEAGLRMAYLQFDGVTNKANSHRKIKNLYDVKVRAIEELAAAGIDVILVVTIVNGLNNDQVGPVVEFAVQNADKVTVVSFQPVSFTGRDEDIADEKRHQQRYTLSHLARDVSAQMGVTDPYRDWFPLSALAPFGNLVDLLDGEKRDFGHVNCGCHPNCGVGTALFVHKKTKQMVPLCDFLNVEGLLHDVSAIFAAGRGRAWAKAQVLTSVLRHYRPDHAPEGFTLRDAAQAVLEPDGGDATPGTRDVRRVRVARALRGGDVVSGPLQLRLPPDGDVHHSLRHAVRGNQLLRLQHGRRLAQHRREDEGDGHGSRMAPVPRAPSDLRQEQRLRPTRDRHALHRRGARACPARTRRQ